MPFSSRQPVLQRVSHGAVSLVAGFCAGLALFLALGAAMDDAVFSALALAVLVAASRSIDTSRQVVTSRRLSGRNGD